MTTSRAWSPLLSGDAAAAALAAVEAIAADLAATVSLIAPFGPDCGVSGVAWTVEHLWGRRCTDVAGEGTWDGEALDLAWQACDHGLAERGVVDAGLRHGVAGRAHLLNRLFQATGEEPFADAARAGFGRLLEMRRPGEGIGGFRAQAPGADGRPVWADDPGLLNGSAGIGLALLAAVSAVEPAWDRLLLAWLQPGQAPLTMPGDPAMAFAETAPAR